MSKINIVTYAAINADLQEMKTKNGHYIIDVFDDVPLCHLKKTFSVVSNKTPQNLKLPW